MTIKILKPVTGLYRVGVAPGNITDLPAELATRMIESGHAEAVEKKTATEKRETAASKKVAVTRKATKKKGK